MLQHQNNPRPHAVFPTFVSSLFVFLLSSDIRREGSIAIVKKIYFDLLMNFHSTSLPSSKSDLGKCLCVRASPIVEPKPIDQSRSNLISRVLL